MNSEALTVENLLAVALISKTFHSFVQVKGASLFT